MALDAHCLQLTLNRQRLPSVLPLSPPTITSHQSSHYHLPLSPPISPPTITSHYHLPLSPPTITSHQPSYQPSHQPSHSSSGRAPISPPTSPLTRPRVGLLSALPPALSLVLGSGSAAVRRGMADLIRIPQAATPRRPRHLPLGHRRWMHSLRGVDACDRSSAFCR